MTRTMSECLIKDSRFKACQLNFKISKFNQLINFLLQTIYFKRKLPKNVFFLCQSSNKSTVWFLTKYIYEIRITKKIYIPFRQINTMFQPYVKFIIVIISNYFFNLANRRFILVLYTLHVRFPCENCIMTDDVISIEIIANHALN